MYSKYYSIHLYLEKLSYCISYFIKNNGKFAKQRNMSKTTTFTPLYVLKNYRPSDKPMYLKNY